ncbi:MAG: SCO family protein [Gammaproteobacteria bacterium]|nr:SCO family protein [Gammaproteobacteria bacterium]
MNKFFVIVTYTLLYFFSFSIGSGSVLASESNAIKNNKTINGPISTENRGGEFSLIGQNGWVSLSDFKGKVVAIYFGYTKCPDVCPTNLSFLSSAVSQLSPEEKINFQSIFISVDPGRDTLEIMADYVKYFDKDMIGLSAAPADLNPVVAQYGAYYEKVPYSNSALMYGVDHTSETYIVGKDGSLFAILPHATKSINILKTIREAMLN